MFALFHKQETLLSLSNAEREEVIKNLVAATTFRHGYYLFLTLSVVIVTLGLLVGNTTIVIGGMVVAPVLTPILLLAISLVARSAHGTFHALRVLVVSLIIAVVLSVALTVLVAFATPIFPHLPDQTNPLLYLLIAFCSGIIASFAWTKKDFSASLAGIAISVALLPPLSIAGIGLTLGAYDAMESSLMVFIANVFGILAASILTFMLLGFHPFKKVTEKAVEQEEKEGGK